MCPLVSIPRYRARAGDGSGSLVAKADQVSTWPLRTLSRARSCITPIVRRFRRTRRLRRSTLVSLKSARRSTSTCSSRFSSRLSLESCTRSWPVEQATEVLKSPDGHPRPGGSFRETRSDPHFPAKFLRPFPPNSHLLELAGGFWDRIGQIRRRSDELDYEGEPSTRLGSAPRLPRASIAPLSGGGMSGAFGGRLAAAMGREYISVGGLETGQQLTTGRAAAGRTSHASLRVFCSRCWVRSSPRRPEKDEEARVNLKGKRIAILAVHLSR